MWVSTFHSIYLQKFLIRNVFWNSGTKEGRIFTMNACGRPSLERAPMYTGGNRDIRGDCDAHLAVLVHWRPHRILVWSRSSELDPRIHIPGCKENTSERVQPSPRGLCDQSAYSASCVKAERGSSRIRVFIIQFANTWQKWSLLGPECPRTEGGGARRQERAR